MVNESLIVSREKLNNRSIVMQVNIWSTYLRNVGPERLL